MQYILSATLPQLKNIYISGYTKLATMGKLFFIAELAIHNMHAQVFFYYFKCQAAASVRSFNHLVSSPANPIIMLIGAGCSVATEPVAEISHHWNLVQVSNYIVFVVNGLTFGLSVLLEYLHEMSIHHGYCNNICQAYNIILSHLHH